VLGVLPAATLLILVGFPEALPRWDRRWIVLPIVPATILFYVLWPRSRVAGERRGRPV
jgi:hypothetical protein